MIETAFKILLVENNKEHADFVRDAVVSDETSPKYGLIVVSEGDAARVVVEDGGFDLIFLGAGLPNAESLELTKALRAQFPDIPVVILARERDRAFAAQIIQSGAWDCLGGDEISAPLLERVARYAIECNSGRRRFEELRSNEERENEIAKLGTLCGPSDLTTALRNFSSSPLMDARPKEFGEEIENYGSLLDRLLDAKDADEQSAIREDLHDLADRLGALNVGPRDLVEIHKAALSRRLRGPFITDSSASVEEGRMLLLQLMGHVVSYYRRLSWGRWRSVALSHGPSKPTGSKRKEKD